MAEGKRYACRCGEPYERLPPDPDHTIELDKPCERGDSIPMTYTCKRCGNQIATVHWDIPHQFMEVI